jgi:alkaline phosphatase
MHDSTDDAQRPTVFDQLLTGMSGTHPDDDTIVTDSAAGATALATGHKTCNRFVALSCAGKPLQTLFQKAKAHQMRTGIVVSSQVNHATPAAYYAHHQSRQAYDAIANQLLDNTVGKQLPVDVIFGGGTRYLVREDRNLVQELKAAGYAYADTWTAVEQLVRAPALALLAEVALPSALDNPVAQPLATLTEKALQLLAGKDDQKGFVLMVEGSQIDWCSHANDIACALAEMHDFAQAVQVARDFVDANPDTLLLITADHETGGLSLGRDGHYAWHADVIRGVTATAPVLASRLLASDPWLRTWYDHTNITLTQEDREHLQAARQQGEAALADAIKSLINQRSFTGWSTGGHTAVDVPLMAYGKGSEQFHGYLDNAEIGRRLMELLQ